MQSVFVSEEDAGDLPIDAGVGMAAAGYVPGVRVLVWWDIDQVRLSLLILILLLLSFCPPLSALSTNTESD
jgi:hypothetical protein